jgi:hypothetical protein
VHLLSNIFGLSLNLLFFFLLHPGTQVSVGSLGMGSERKGKDQLMVLSCFQRFIARLSPFQSQWRLSWGRP